MSTLWRIPDLIELLDRRLEALRLLLR